MADMGKRNHYIDRADFTEALLEAQAHGQPTERVCRLFRLLIERYLSGVRYSRYDTATKEDMSSAALIKCLKNLHNYTAGKGSPFSYFTRAVECCCIDYLKRHYKHINLIRDLADRARQAIWPNYTPPHSEEEENPSRPEAAN